VTRMPDFLQTVIDGIRGLASRLGPDPAQTGRSRRQGPLRVLFIGNIANNAYLIAKMLRREGVDVDVMCPDYYHVMACPEWEEQRLPQHGDDYAPSFVTDESRPRWFVQGPSYTCILYLLLRRQGDPDANRLWKLLGRSLGHEDIRTSLIFEAKDFIDARFDVRSMMNPSLFPERLRSPAGLYGLSQDQRVRAAMEEFTALFEGLYPQWGGCLDQDQLFAHTLSAEYYSALFEQYDVVQFFGGAALWNALCRPARSVAYEHGTLRVLPHPKTFSDYVTAAGYRLADQVFITNGDCLEHAQTLGIPNYGAMLHPVDVEQHQDAEGADALPRGGADVVLFCYLRHDWAAKGTDVHLRALPLIKARLPGKRVRLVLTEWGGDLEASRMLLSELGVADDCVWVQPQSRRALIDMTREADVVLDQMALPHFGQSAPQAIAVGTPVISSYVPQSTAWLVDEPAPILAAFTPEDVADQVCRALDPQWRAEWRGRAETWIKDHHHQDIITDRHRTVFDGLAATIPPHQHLQDASRALVSARVRSRLRPEDVARTDHNSGIEITSVGAAITLPRVRWHHGPEAPLDFGDIDFETEDCWVRVRLTAIDGEVGLSLFDSRHNRIAAEVMLSSQRAVRRLPLRGDESEVIEVVFKAEDSSVDVLLIRTGEVDGFAVKVTFIDAEILTAPRPGVRHKLHNRIVRAKHDPGDVFSYEYWQNAGAGVVQMPTGAVITLPPIDWHYAAAIALDFSMVDFDREDCWVRVELTDIHAQIRVSLFDGDANSIVVEKIRNPRYADAHLRLLDDKANPTEILLKAEDALANLLMFRAGRLQGDRLEATFVCAEILTEAKEPKDAAISGEENRTKAARSRAVPVD
jgi:glycosyltransferase involved in cell wall biosynthesis